MFIDYSSAFNTIVLSKVITLGLDPNLCNWVLDFLTGRLQMVGRSAQRITGANYLPSRTPTAPDVTGRPK